MSPPAPGSPSGSVFRQFEVKEADRLQMESDPSIDPEEKLILEEQKGSSLTLRLIVVVVFAIFILVGWYLIN
jgi:hypothetical protein